MPNRGRLMFVCVLLALAGCNSDNGQSRGGGAGATTDSSQAPQQPAPPAAEGNGGLLDSILRGVGKYADRNRIVADDVLAVPGESVRLEARVMGEYGFKPLSGKEVVFLRDDKPFKTVTTDADGLAAVDFTPPKRGNYYFSVAPAAGSRYEQGEAPTSSSFFVAARPKDEPIAIVDLDDTVTGSSFYKVMLGVAEPMPDAPEVLGELAKDYTIVYLTHRPTYLGRISRDWLKEKDFPAGPVMLSTWTQFISGSGTYKTERLKLLRERFPNIKLGIGDKISDALAYKAIGMNTYVIVPGKEDDPKDLEKKARELGELPEDVQVVQDWQQIRASLTKGERYPRSAAQQRLLNLANQLRRGG